MINELPHYLAKINVAHILWARRSQGSQPSSQLGRRHLAMSSLGRLSAVASAVKASALPSPRRIINRSYFSSRLKYQNVIADSDQQAMTICSCRTRRCGWRQATWHMHLCVLVCVCVCVCSCVVSNLGTPQCTRWSSDWLRTPPLQQNPNPNLSDLSRALAITLRVCDFFNCARASATRPNPSPSTSSSSSSQSQSQFEVCLCCPCCGADWFYLLNCWHSVYCLRHCSLATMLALSSFWFHQQISISTASVAPATVKFIAVCTNWWAWSQAATYCQQFGF